MNVIIDCQKKTDDALSKKVEQLKIRNYKFLYSPAHIEEIAVILRSEPNQELAIEYINDGLSFISSLTNNNEYLPHVNGVVPSKEPPRVCYERVTKDYESTTIFAEDNEEFLQSFKNKDSCEEYMKKNGGTDINIESMPLFENFQKFNKIDKQEINRISPESVFESEGILKALDNYLFLYGYSTKILPKYLELKDNFQKLELIIGLMFNFLEQVGYRTEKKGKYRSRMHDVTHGIYATKSDYFIIGDKRYREKAKAIYSYLKIPSQIYSKEEFIELKD